MKAKRTIWVVLCLLSLCWAACDDEVLPTITEGDRPLAEGEFVIDYAGGGLDTRSIHTGVPKNVRISSLTYLLYGIDGNLIKRREIPDIDENTVWPLRRETMTWAQREALKDTLDTRRMNAVAFVANIDPEKCGWKDAEGNPRSPLRNADNFNQAYLELPLQPFTDKNMFYIFTCDTLLADMERVDRDHPLNYPIVLHRAVTRTDFFREQLPEWEQIDAMTPEALPQPGDTVYNYMAYYVKDIFVENLNPKEDKKTTLLNSLVKEQIAFLQEIYDYFEKQSWIYTAISDWLKVDKYVKLYTYIKTTRDYLNANKETVKSYLIASDRSDAIFKAMVNDCLLNMELRERWKESWCKGKWARLAYKDDNNGANQFLLKSHRVRTGAGASPLMEVDTSIVVTDLVYNFNTCYSGFSHIGFANPEQNVLSAIHWYADEKDLTSPSSTLRRVDGLTTRQEGNEWYEVRYNPMLPLSYNATADVRQYDSEYDLNKLPFEEALRKEKMSDDEWNKLLGELKKAIEEEALPNFSGENREKYFGKDVLDTELSLEKVKLTIQYPDLSQKGTLVFKEKWNIRKVQGR